MSISFDGSGIHGIFDLILTPYFYDLISHVAHAYVSNLTAIPHGQSRPPDVKRELVRLSVPALAGQAIDPLAQLMETAYIGRLGMFSLESF